MKDKFYIYLFSLFKGNLPYRHKGSTIIDNLCVINYDILSTNKLDIDEIIKETREKCIYFDSLIETKALTNKFLEKQIKCLISYQLSSKDKFIFFNKFKLQNYLEYKSELRDLIINDILK